MNSEQIETKDLSDTEGSKARERKKLAEEIRKEQEKSQREQ